VIRGGFLRPGPPSESGAERSAAWQDHPPAADSLRFFLQRGAIVASGNRCARIAARSRADGGHVYTLKLKANDNRLRSFTTRMRDGKDMEDLSSGFKKIVLNKTADK
jgi:hypothetical protein